MIQGCLQIFRVRSCLLRVRVKSVYFDVVFVLYMFLSGVGGGVWRRSCNAFDGVLECLNARCGESGCSCAIVF